MVKFLIDKGADLQTPDKKGLTPSLWAKKLNKNEILSLILENGGVLGDQRRPKVDTKRPVPAAKEHTEEEVPPEQPKPAAQMNEKKIPKRYLLTTLREGGYYSPMTDAEFEEFKRQNPQIARYFEIDQEGSDVHPVSKLQLPKVPESAPIFDQWEKAAQRMM